jgi:predicted nucleic acid-binding protein
VKVQTVILDANILFPAPLRDFFMYLAILGGIQARWSKRIEDEWTRNLIAKRPDLSPERVYRTAAAMNAAIPDALVEDFEQLEQALVLPDPDDRHVLAAAVKGKAQVIITKNLRDFPAQTTQAFEIEVMHPDVFVHHLLHLEPRPVIQTIKAIKAALKNPPKSFLEILDTLEQQEMPLTADWLREVFDDEWKNGMNA